MSRSKDHRRCERRFAAERDRRYAEVAVEREKALRIKEQADRDALSLARADQTYKDERANNLRTQLERERGDYATKDDLSNAIREVVATVKPLAEYVASQQGVSRGGRESRAGLYAAITLAAVVAGVLVGIVNAALN